MKAPCPFRIGDVIRFREPGAWAGRFATRRGTVKQVCADHCLVRLDIGQNRTLNRDQWPGVEIIGKEDCAG
jgi:hypothetical protein